MASPESTGEIQELHSRESDGISVRLLWNSGTNEVCVAVNDIKTGGAPFEISVDPADALEAFKHPYAFAGSQAVAGFEGKSSKVPAQGYQEATD